MQFRLSNIYELATTPKHLNMKGPEFLKYINPVLTTLQSNGGAGNSSDVIEQVIDKLGITETELEETTSNGQSRIRNQI